MNHHHALRRFRQAAIATITATIAASVGLIGSSATQGQEPPETIIQVCKGSGVSCSNCTNNPTTGGDGLKYGCQTGLPAGNFQFGSCQKGQNNDSCTQQTQTCGPLMDCAANKQTTNTCTNMTICDSANGIIPVD